MELKSLISGIFLHAGKHLKPSPSIMPHTVPLPLAGNETEQTQLVAASLNRNQKVSPAKNTHNTLKINKLRLATKKYTQKKQEVEVLYYKEKQQ